MSVFSCAVLAMLGSFFVAKECLEQMMNYSEQEPIGSHHSTTWILPSAFVACLVHVFLQRADESQRKALNAVINGSASSWLQEHCGDVSQTLCRLFPGLSFVLLPRVNTLSFLNASGWLLATSSLVLADSRYDRLLALLMVFVLLSSLKPLVVYTGRILLQSSPGHMLPQLNKCLRETATFDGVLEVAEERLWQLSLGQMAGSAVVRVRRDTDEQLVLAHLLAKLHFLAANLTVQVNKDVGWRPIASTNY